jgi:hypothetical protein
VEPPSDVFEFLISPRTNVTAEQAGLRSFGKRPLSGETRER